MPSLIFHLHLAKTLASQNPVYAVPDFFLGHIAPDAPLSAATPPPNYPSLDAYKNAAHLRPAEGVSGHRLSPDEAKALWRENALANYRAIKDPDLFDLGYAMHILTDIEFRRYMRHYYDTHQIPEAERENHDAYLMPKLFRSLFPSALAYLDCLDFAAQAPRKNYPFAIDAAAMRDHIDYARELAVLFTEPSIEANQKTTLPDIPAEPLTAMILQAISFQNPTSNPPRSA